MYMRLWDILPNTTAIPNRDFKVRPQNIRQFWTATAIATYQPSLQDLRLNEVGFCSSIAMASNNATQNCRTSFAVTRSWSPVCKRPKRPPSRSSQTLSSSDAIANKPKHWWPHIRPSCGPSSTTPPTSGSPKHPHHTWTKLEVIQNKALRIATGCHQKAAASHLRAEIGVLPLKSHLELCCQQFYASSLQTLHPGHLIVTSPRSRAIRATL